MREEIYRLLSPPERGTPKYWAITAARESSNLLLLGMGFMLIARACGNLDTAPGSMAAYLMFALSVLFMARFTIGPAISLLKKLVGMGRKEGQDS